MPTDPTPPDAVREALVEVLNCVEDEPEAYEACERLCAALQVSREDGFDGIADALLSRATVGGTAGETFPLTLSDGSVVERIVSEGDAPVFRRAKPDELIAESYDWLNCILADDCGRDHDRLKTAALLAQTTEGA